MEKLIFAPKVRDNPFDFSHLDPEPDDAYFELMRRSTPQRRLQIAMELSDRAIRLSREAIRQAHPKASEDELKVLFAKYHYGDTLADGVRSALRERRMQAESRSRPNS